MKNPTRLRVLQILPTFGVGGAENMAAHLMTGLAADHDVTALGLYPSNGSPIEKRLEGAGIPLVHLGKRRGVDLRIIPRLTQALRELNPHVVHTHLSVLRYVYPALVRRPAPVAVHTLHNTAEREADTVGRLVHRLAFRGLVHPVSISRHGSTSFSRVYKRDCAAMVPNSIPVRAYERPLETGQRWRAALGLPERAMVYVCIGRLEPQKNPIGLLNAFAAVDHPDAHLVLLGDGNLRERVTEHIRALGLGARVHLLGKRNDIPDCLAACDVFVLASHWEGNPLSVMEAMAAGLPVVSTTVGGVPELVANDREGVLVPAGDEHGLAIAMRLMAGNGPLRATLGAAARERAKAEFDVDNMTRRYSALYRSLFDAAQLSPSWTKETWAGNHSAQPAGGEES